MCMRRREFSRLSAATLLAASGPALAQKDLPLVAVIIPGTEHQARIRLADIRTGLEKAGFIEGVHFAFAMRYADAVFSRLPGLVQELAALKPRVIVSVGVAPVVAKYA